MKFSTRITITNIIWSAIITLPVIILAMLLLAVMILRFILPDNFSDAVGHTIVIMIDRLFSIRKSRLLAAGYNLYYKDQSK